MTKSRQLQIGVIGSAGIVNAKLTRTARNLGKLIAKNNAVLLFGFEGDIKSVSEIAAKSCIKNGGEVIAFLWGNQKTTNSLLDKSLIISTGLERGGGREFVFIRSCDAVIAIGGGSGTLTEIAIAYQMSIPVITIKDSDGWSEKLKGQYLDERKKVLIEEAENETDALIKVMGYVKI